VIINEYWIMTAAHCVERDRPRDVVAYIGEHDMDDWFNEYRAIHEISAIYIHPEYDAAVELDADIAMLSVTWPIAMNEYTQPACKADDYPRDYAGATSVVSGWGTLSSGGQSPSVLHCVELPIITQAACRSSGLPAQEVTDGMVCAGRVDEDEKDSCQGDSGGPLVVAGSDGRYQLVGLVSWGYGCASGTPGVYTRVNYYHDFVDLVLALGQV